jgi:hypothetical protein
MAELFMNKMITLILGLGVLLILLAFMYSYYTTYLLPQTRLDFSDLDLSVQSAIQTSANNFVSNLEACKIKSNSNCICKNVFANFPTEVTLQIINKGTIPLPKVNIMFLYNEKSFRNNELNNLHLFAVSSDGKTLTVKEITYENIIKFGKSTEINSASILHKNWKIASLDVYKNSDKEISLITGDDLTLFSKLPLC